MRFLSLPIKPILLCSLLSISVIPTLIVSMELYSFAKQNAHQVLDEKHLSLARNLTAPVFAYLENHRTIVQSISRRIQNEIETKRSTEKFLINEKLDFKNIRQMAYYDAINNSVVQTDQQLPDSKILSNLNATSCIQTQSSFFSPIIENPFATGKTILVCEPVFNKQKFIGIVIAALNLDMIEQYRKGIAFGESGHSAIVDQAGVVVAHPNADWTVENRDISDWPIVKAMIKGEEGITQFYSAFTQKDMVAAFTTVPEFGWGIMVPQLKSEIDERIFASLWPQLKWGVISIIFAIILSILLSKWIANPLTQLVKGTFQLSENRLNGGVLKLPTNSPKELKILSNALDMMTRQFIQIKTKLENVNNTLQNRVDEATEQLRDQNQRLEQMAICDELTGLFNRRGLKQSLEDTLAVTKNSNSVFSVLVCDLDHFKLVNDNYGHRIGDNVLQAFAKIAPTGLREHDYIGRWGGEEFLCVLAGANSETAMQVAERIRSSVQEVAVLPDALGLEITVSIGVATYPHDSDTIDELISCADNALYEAKHTGRNKVICHNGLAKSASHISKQIRLALNDNGLRTAFQAIYSLSDKHKVGNQSLARIHNQNEEALGANLFIHQAEELGLIEKIDEFVINETLNYLDNNYALVGEKLAFVHLSTDYLSKLTPANKLIKRIKQIKAKHQYDSEFPLVIELSEAQFKGNEKSLKEAIKMLLDYGIKLALRKFETSTTGLELLTTLPFDYVKLDGSSIRLAMNNSRYELALKHLITMCKDLDLNIIVEQIETTYELDYCKVLNIDLGQGYCLARPVIPNDMTASYDV